MKKREFLKKSGLGALSALAIPTMAMEARSKSTSAHGRLRVANIGVGNMGMADLTAISSHPDVDIVALCDVDAIYLSIAKKMHPKARIFTDYRMMFNEMAADIDAVVVSTPDHTHAPASIMAMELDKSVYCQKPLTHYVAESRKMKEIAQKRNLVTQMGIQVHSFYDYKLATLLIQDGIIGKVHTVYAWSPKSWGYDGPAPSGEDRVPPQLDWNLWLGPSKHRPYKEGSYAPGNWRKVMDYGCGTLGDMGVHIMDTPYNALNLGVPRTIKNECRESTGFGYPLHNIVTYEFPGTEYTTDTLKWVWSDGPGMPKINAELTLPAASSEMTTKTKMKEESLENMTSLDSGMAEKGKLPNQGAMFVGTKGRLLLPHFMQLPSKIVDGEYVDISKQITKLSKKHNLGEPIRNYESEGPKHYHEFVDECLGKGPKCSAPFDYAARLTETILLGVIAGRFPGQTLHWDAISAKFAEEEANQYLQGDYREY